MSTRQQKPILLGPAGSEKMAVAAMESGADMVYSGPIGWSRRTRAFEIDDNAISNINSYCRKNGKGLKLAFNTLPSSSEIDQGINAIASYMEMGINDFIMTDPGFVRRVKNRFPKTRITASVGCSMMNIREFRFFKDVGFDVIVAPSEIQIEELRRIRKDFDGEIEILIHANRDYTYLGRCTMSSYFNFIHSIDEKGKDNFFGSPNRGGLCYRVCKSGWNGSLDDKNCFNNMDLGNHCYFSLKEIPEYMKMGIDCLKIQGREYSAGLVADIVRFYRKLIDSCAEDPDAIKDPDWASRLKKLSLQRDNERNRRTQALLNECNGEGDILFARLDTEEKAWS